MVVSEGRARTNKQKMLRIACGNVDFKVLNPSFMLDMPRKIKLQILRSAHFKVNSLTFWSTGGMPPPPPASQFHVLSQLN